MHGTMALLGYFASADVLAALLGAAGGLILQQLPPRLGRNEKHAILKQVSWAIRRGSCVNSF